LAHRSTVLLAPPPGRTAPFTVGALLLGFDLEFDTGHASGQLRNGDGPYIFVAEVPEDHEPQLRLVLQVESAAALELDASVEVVSAFEETHFGTKEMVVRDRDGRLWSLQAPVAS
jgi:uncharacterized glyoxalase superfamily protein PhnB